MRDLSADDATGLDNQHKDAVFVLKRRSDGTPVTTRLVKVPDVEIGVEVHAG